MEKNMDGLTRLKIGVDVDDVIVNFIAAFRREAEFVLGKKLSVDPGSWTFKNWELSQTDIEKVWDHIKQTDNWFFYNFYTLPFVPENLPWLVEEHDVYFITARIPTAGFSVQKQTQLYLSELGVQFPTVLVEPNKGPLAAALKLDAFIDDKVENLLDIDKATQSRTKVFLMSRSYNAEYSIPNHWTRVNHFADFVSKIQEME